MQPTLDKPLSLCGHTEGSTTGSHLSAPPFLENKIPLEILGEIIDYLKESRSDLAICSLVCRAWLLSSRPILFSNAFVTRSNHDQFVRLATSAYVTFIPFIRNLALSSFVLSGPWLGTVFGALLFTGTLSLEKISITSADFRDTTLDTWEKYHEAVTGVTYLNLFDCNFSNIIDLARFLSSFPELETLSIRDTGLCTQTMDLVDAAQSHRLRRHISALRVTVNTMDDKHIAIWLSRQEHFSQLQTLAYSSPPLDPEISILEILLKATGQSINCLELNPACCPAPAPDFTTCKSLRSLVLIPRYWPDDTWTVLRGTLAILANIPAGLEELQLDLLRSSGVGHGHLFADDLRAILDSPRFSTLRSLRLVVFNTWPQDDDDVPNVEAQLRERFPVQSASGILSFVHK